MINCIDIYKIKDFILKNDSFIISTHLSPDGDAIGSSVGLCDYLLKLGKNAKIINNDPTPAYLQYIDEKQYIDVYDDVKHKRIIEEADIVFILDLNDIKRLGKIGEFYVSLNKTMIVIDHHLEPKEFANYYYKDTDIASTSEIIFDLIKLFPEDYSFITAQALYTGITTDTGNFAFDRTTAETHLRVADLIKHNVQPHLIYDRINNSKDLNSLHFYGDVLKSIELFKNNSVAIMTISQDMLQRYNKTENELDGYSVAPLMIESVKSAVTIVETSTPNCFKLSFRAKKGYGIRNIAVKLGGGGHELAAGAKVYDTTLEEVRNSIISEF